MKSILLCILISIATTYTFSQVTLDVNLGDTYQTVIDKIQKDFNHKFYSLSKSKDVIRVTIKTNSGLDEGSIQMYQFANNHLLRIYNVSSINPDGQWRALYQMSSEKNGQPYTVNVGKLQMKYWKLDPKPRGYLYFAYSDWFRKECLFLLQTEEHFEIPSAKNKTKPIFLTD